MASEEIVLNGRYRLIKQQGSGGMAVVYQAQDIALSRTVAVKVLRPSLMSDPLALNRFRQEARNVANLSHPNIVTLHDVGQDGNTYYMVMEFVDGQDLKKIVRAGAPFSVERTLRIGIQICNGIGYAHRAGLVHADLKPQNILITGSDIVKVTDFGIAQAFSNTQPQERQAVIWGTPQYFAPEQARGEPPTPASDVYAIGIVLFEMLTGQLPFGGSTGEEIALAHLRQETPHVRDQNPQVPANVDWLVHKVMSKEAAGRYRTADQLGRILASYAGQLTNGGSTPQPEPPPPAQPIGSAKPPTGPSQPVIVQPGNSGSAAPINPSRSQPPVVQPNVPPAEPVIQKPVFLPSVAPLKPNQSSPQVPPASYIPPAGGSGTGSMSPSNPSRGMSAPQAPSQASPYVPSSGYTPQPQPVNPGAGQYAPSGYTPPPPAPPVDSYSGYSQSYPYAPSASGRVAIGTILLGGVALFAVFGLIVVWLLVWSAYMR